MKPTKYKGIDKKTGELVTGYYIPVIAENPNKPHVKYVRHYIVESFHAIGGLIYLGKRHLCLYETIEEIQKENK